MYHVLAENETRPFTRRVASLPPKQAARDSKIVSQIVRAGDIEGNYEKVKDIFFRKARLLSNPVYWEVLRTVWVMSGCTENAKEFLPFLKSSRPCRSWFMTIEDAQTLESMEFPITVYRAYEKEPDEGISWTLDNQWCEGYAASKGRKVKSRTVERKDVFAYISRRGEEEIMILY